MTKRKTPAYARYKCVTCGETHDDLPDIGATYPAPYLEVPEDKRDELTTVSGDLCTVVQGDDTHHMIRGVILIPLRDSDREFGLGVWVSQSQLNYGRYAANEDMEATLGFVVTYLTFYPETTFGLKARVHFRGKTLRPSLELQPTDHPLSIEQREGITLDRAWEIVHRFLPN